MLIYDTLAYVDIDALKMTRGESWERLRHITQKKTLTGQEIGELSRLYQAATHDLATIRSGQADPDTIRVLSRDLAAARAVLTGTRSVATQTIARWFRIDLPAALYEIRWWTIGAAAIFVIVAAIHTLYILLNPELFAVMGTPSQLAHQANVDFVQYYSQDTNSEFATSVWVNNSYVSAQMIALGITGIGPAYILYSNAQSVGVTAAVVFEYAGVWHFFRYILPHGMPELTAVFIAAAAGFRTFWSLIVPGKQTRAQALGQTGRAMITVAMGLVILLFFAGMIEGFVTPSRLPDWLRLLLGVLVTVALWVYILVPGKRAYEAGYRGDIEESKAGYWRRGN